jgi:hypothetical protein
LVNPKVQFAKGTSSFIPQKTSPLFLSASDWT